jgi:hypothetical protein
VQNYQFAVSQVAQTSLRSVIGQSDMDQPPSERCHTVQRPGRSRPGHPPVGLVLIVGLPEHPGHVLSGFAGDLWGLDQA